MAKIDNYMYAIQLLIDALHSEMRQTRNTESIRHLQDALNKLEESQLALESAQKCST